MLAVKVLAAVILFLGLGSAGVTGYLFFVVLPPLLSTVDQTAEYLASLRVPDINLEESAGKIRAASDGIPACPPQQYGGCLVFDMRQTKAELNGLASSLEDVDADVQANAAGLEAQIRSTGAQLYFVRPMVIAMVGWMFAVSVVLALSGVAFLLVGRELDKRLKQGAKGLVGLGSAAA